MKKCRVGDLVLVVNARNTEKGLMRIGTQAEVIREPVDERHECLSGRFVRIVGITPTQAWEIKFQDGYYTVFDDNNLMPIRPSDERLLEDELTRELEGVQ